MSTKRGREDVAAAAAAAPGATQDLQVAPRDDDRNDGAVTATPGVEASSLPAAAKAARTEAGPADAAQAARRRFPKRKVALLVAYLGTGFSGFQRNPGVRTIEDELEDALFAAGAILPANRGNLNKLSWLRSCRTDKGVHAAGQVVSMKAVLEPDEASFTARVNSHLPATIRLLGWQRVPGAFHPKNHADGRNYEYCLPTFALMPATDGPFSVMEKLFRYRLTDERRALVDELLACYVGTNNFHNFTGSVEAKAASNMRYITSFAIAGQPFLMDGIEYVSIIVRGQSFILHQIRKMIGMMVAVARGHCTKAQLLVALRSHDKVDVPMAPGTGLMLNRVYYESFDRRSVQRAQAGTEPVKITVWDDSADAVALFKREVLYPHIVQQESKVGTFQEFLGNLTHRAASGVLGNVRVPATARDTAAAPAPAAAAATSAGDDDNTGTGGDVAVAAAPASSEADGGSGDGDGAAVPAVCAPLAADAAATTDDAGAGAASS